MYSLIVSLLIFILYGIWEYQRHKYYRRRIPLVIHVNGTRGKSSVTRLIAAGLRAGGKRTLAKTTGSAPVIIHENGSESPIQRPFGPNIREQIKIIRHAANKKVDALVLECMAVTPEYQWISEHKIIKSDISVITNSRLDHLDLMGPGIRNVTYSLCNTLPENKIAFTSEIKMLPLMDKKASSLGSKLAYVDKSDVQMEELKNFNHIEHRENVALALKVCTQLGIDRKIALTGMYKAKPDIGAAEIFEVCHQEKRIYFVHSFAANDPESTGFLIENVKQIHPHLESLVMVLNTRADRMFRSRQLIEMLRDMQFNRLFLIGDQCQSIKNYALNKGIKKEKIHVCGWITGEELIECLDKMTEKEILLFGIGNIGGNGGRIMRYFKERNKSDV